MVYVQSRVRFLIHSWSNNAYLLVGGVGPSRCSGFGQFTEAAENLRDCPVAGALFSRHFPLPPAVAAEYPFRPCGIHPLAEKLTEHHPASLDLFHHPNFDLIADFDKLPGAEQKAWRGESE